MKGVASHNSEKHPKLALALVSFILLLCAAAYADNSYLNIWLFRGTPQEASFFLDRPDILTVDSRPELSLLKEQIGGSEESIKVAALRALVEMYQLLSIDDIYSLKQTIGRTNKSIDRIAVAEDSVYRIRTRIINKSGLQISVHLQIERSKPGVFRTDSTGQARLRSANFIGMKKGSMDGLVEQDVILERDVPVILAVPREKEINYALLLLSSANTMALVPAEVTEKAKERQIGTSEVPMPIQVVDPDYPSELKRRLIGGEIHLRIALDKKGNVLGVAIEKGVHPYLDYCAVQAFLRWKFAPIIRKGKPVQASFSFNYLFDPRSDGPQSAEIAPVSNGLASSSNKLHDILTKVQDYCSQLSEAALSFVCEETIREIHYNLIDNISWEMLVLNRDSQIMVGRPVQIIDPRRTIRNEFICDYQLVRKGGAVKESRVVQEENGKAKRGPNPDLKEDRFSGLNSLLSPLRVLAGARQELFMFSFIKTQRVHGKDAYVLNAMPKAGNEDGIWAAKIWIDQDDYGVLRCDIEGIPLDGYEDVLRDCSVMNIKPSFMISHEYGYEKNGVHLPSRSKIRVSYPALDVRGPIEKLSIDLGYDKYRFFTVDTSTQVIRYSVRDP